MASCVIFQHLLIGGRVVKRGCLTIGNRNAVKGWLRRSETYNRLVSVLLDSVKQSNTSGQNGAVPVDRAEVQTIVQNAFPPSLLQENTEKFIDGTYNWLDGKSDKPFFRLDFTAAKAQLANGIGDYVKQRLTGLPNCKAVQNPDTFDVFSATCVPIGLNAAAAGKQVTDALASDSGFLANPVITENSITVSKNLLDTAQSGSAEKVNFFDQPVAKQLPSYYRWSHIMPFIFAVLSLASVAAIVFSSADRRQGMLRVGFTLLWTGGLLLLSVLIFGLASGRVKSSLVVGQTLAYRQLITGLVDAVFADINNILLWFGASFLTGGAICLTITYSMRGRFVERNEYGQKLAPKESPADVRARYKRELAEFIKQQEAASKALAPKESTEAVKRRYQRELASFIKRERSKDNRWVGKAGDSASEAEPVAAAPRPAKPAKPNKTAKSMARAAKKVSRATKKSKS